MTASISGTSAAFEAIGRAAERAVQAFNAALDVIFRQGMTPQQLRGATLGSEETQMNNDPSDAQCAIHGAYSEGGGR